MRVDFKELIGKTFTDIKKSGEGLVGEEILFIVSDTEKYLMKHEQDCCESVYLEDITGDIEDLIGAPILKASEDTNSDENPPDADKEKIKFQESFTWTFYNIATEKGHITMRWYGESNGYYSESVDLFNMDEDGSFSRY